MEPTEPDVDVTFAVFGGDQEIRDAKRIRATLGRLRAIHVGISVLLALVALVTWRTWPLIVLVAIWVPSPRGFDLRRWRRDTEFLARWEGPTAGTIRVRRTGILLDHPTLLGALHVTRADLRCFAVDPDPDDQSPDPSVGGFPVQREPGLGYRRREPKRLVPGLPMLVLDQDGTRPDVAILFERTIEVRAIAPRGGVTVPDEPRVRLPRSLLIDRTWGLERSAQVVHAPGVYLRLASVGDVAGLRAALLAIGLREGVTADDIPGAPPHLPLPPQRRRDVDGA